MGLRYRRSFRLSPSARLNITGRGISSVTMGRPGSTVNIGPRGVRSTVGIPGTGLSYSSRSSGAALVVGMAIAGAFSVMLLAARGNRAARVAILAVCAFCAYAALGPAVHRVAPDAVVPGISPPPDPAISAPVSAAIYPVVSAVDDRGIVPATHAPEILIATTGVNVRSGPSARMAVVGQLRLSEQVAIDEAQGGWVRIGASGDRPAGWVNRHLLAQP